MSTISVIAVFDIGKTNKKLLLFDEQYHVVLETAVRLPETVDEDGDACEDIAALRAWVLASFEELLRNDRFRVVAVNFSAYGASLVHLDESGSVLTPLYNYLKIFPDFVLEYFISRYGGSGLLARESASPVLGSLNSGLQLLRLKQEQPDLFSRIATSLHLPQYLSYLFTGEYCSDLTSIGCHTALWNFDKQDYHAWVYQEAITEKLAEVQPADAVKKLDSSVLLGVGLHDSSAALIPYLMSFKEPFVLISTGTWAISMNPFNNEPLTNEELEQDCLCYLGFQGQPVKASRLFAGDLHEKGLAELAVQFNCDRDYYKTVAWGVVAKSGYEEGYYHLMKDIVAKQVRSLRLVMPGNSVKRIFVDGGFSKNVWYMHLLAQAFPDIEVYAASMAQATALGAALAIHEHWNRKRVPADLIELKLFTGSS